MQQSWVLAHLKYSVTLRSSAAARLLSRLVSFDFHSSQCAVSVCLSGPQSMNRNLMLTVVSSQRISSCREVGWRRHSLQMSGSTCKRACKRLQLHFTASPRHAHLLVRVLCHVGLVRRQRLLRALVAPDVRVLVLVPQLLVAACIGARGESQSVRACERTCLRTWVHAGSRKRCTSAAEAAPHRFSKCSSDACTGSTTLVMPVVICTTALSVASSSLLMTS